MVLNSILNNGLKKIKIQH